MKLHSQILKFSNSQFFFAVLAWSLLVLRFGYRFGTGDHVEYLPYVLYMNDHSLYAHDYFLQGLVQKVPNERSIVCLFLSLFGKHLEAACFTLHFITTVSLMVGLQKLGELLTKNIAVTRVAILLNFFLLFDRGLGNVELYSDALQGSSISVAIISFALFYFFCNRFMIAAMLMSMASIIHPVEGLTVFMVMSGVLFCVSFFNSEISKRMFLQFILIYAATAGVFIVLLLSQKFDGTSIPNNELFYRIYHEFRHAHHYVFSYLPLSEKYLFIFFTGVIVFGASLFNRKLAWFGVFAFLGTLIYILCTDVLHLPQIANLQFYKVSQWVKFFAVLILMKWLFNLSSLKKVVGYFVTPPVMVLGLLIALVLIVSKPDFIDRGGVYHQYGKNWKAENDIVLISERIDKEIGKDAIFVQPFSCTELKYYGRTSSWVDWKAFVKDQSKIEEWYRRIQVVYGISIKDAEKGFMLSTKADSNFCHMNTLQLNTIKREGVTHILTKKEFPVASGKLILQNNTYAVYQL
jgi:hypothetical protein